MKDEYKVFVSMPFGPEPSDPNNEWTKLYESGIVPLQAEFPDKYRIKILRADHTLKDLGLKDHVKRCIEESDLLIAVLTENPNVFWEIGYAEALEKPIVFLADKKAIHEKRVPVLAGQPNFCEYEHGIIKETSAKNAHASLSPIRRDLPAYIKKAVGQVGHTRAGQSTYKVTAYGRREFVHIHELISHAQRRVDVLTTNLDWLVTSRHFNISESSRHPFSKAIANGARVRVVSMDPEAVIAEYRAKQLGEEADIPGYRTVLRRSIQHMYRIFKNNSGKFYLRIYSELPLQITYIIDDVVVTGIIARVERSRELIHIEFHRGSAGVEKSFISHFESLYNASADASRFNWVTRSASRAGLPSIDEKQEDPAEIE